MNEKLIEAIKLLAKERGIDEEVNLTGQTRRTTQMKYYGL